MEHKLKIGIIILVIVTILTGSLFILEKKSKKAEIEFPIDTSKEAVEYAKTIPMKDHISINRKETFGIHARYYEYCPIIDKEWECWTVSWGPSLGMETICNIYFKPDGTVIGNVVCAM